MPNWDGGQNVNANGRPYETIAAGQAAQILGTTGATGDAIDGMWIFPATLAPGVVSVLDLATVVWSWPAGIVPADLRPIFVPLNLRSANGAWKITTGVNISVLAWGQFT